MTQHISNHFYIYLLKELVWRGMTDLAAPL